MSDPPEGYQLQIAYDYLGVGNSNSYFKKKLYDTVPFPI